MALVDTLDYFPEQHSGRARLLSYLQSLADAIVLSQDRTYKGWYNIMDPGMESRSGNYIESSASAMFVYGLFKSLRHGYISGEQYEAAATSGYELMTLWRGGGLSRLDRSARMEPSRYVFWF
jgi:rhamnogalacturonyl hydrolase YesR